MNREKKLSLPPLEVPQELDRTRKLSYNSAMAPYRKSSLQSIAPRFYVNSKAAINLERNWSGRPSVSSAMAHGPYSNNNYSTGVYSANQSLDVRPKKETKVRKERSISTVSKGSRTLSMSNKSMRLKPSRKLGRAEQGVEPLRKSTQVLPDIQGAMALNPVVREIQDQNGDKMPMDETAGHQQRKKSQIDHINTNTSDSMQYMISLLDRQLTISQPDVPQHGKQNQRRDNQARGP